MADLPDAVFETDFSEVPRISRGKVRDIYDLGDSLLIVTSDRLSAFDYVLPDPIPEKGKVLNQVAAFWFDRFAQMVPNHVIELDADRFPEVLAPHRDTLAGRSVVARKLKMLPIECVARGYLSGSGWKEYKRDGTVCGIPLPEGLTESSRLPEPIFTPATKAESGHDENISFERAVEIVGQDIAEQVRDLTLSLYSAGVDYAASKGIIIADTKFEFGMDGDELVLADEVLTPDSSRFWPADKYEAGKGQPSFDKQYVRDYLESISWNKQPPVPGLPAEIVAGTRDRYREIYRILTDRELD